MMKRKKIVNASKKGISISLALAVIFQVIFPTVSYGLTSGPLQQEYGSFEPAGTSDLVDLYTGDFTYNIPLLSVPGPNGGYPINMAYHSGVNMEEEASWVGLGWGLNVGSVNRGMRGLPDDFCGDGVVKETKMRKNWMADISMQVSPSDYREWFGIPYNISAKGLNGQFNLYYNNYKGVGYRVGTSISLASLGPVYTGVGLSYDSQSGIGVEPRLGMNLISADVKGEGHGSFASASIGLTYNSRQGITGGNIMGMSFDFNGRVPSATIPTRTLVQPFSIKIGRSSRLARFKAKSYAQVNGSYFETDFSTGSKSYGAYGYSYTNNAPAGSMKDFTRSNVEYTKHLPNLPASTFNSDNFSYSAQGAYGSFRPWLAGVPVLSDATVENRTENFTPLAGIEVGIGATTANFGLDLTYFDGFNRSGGWQNSGKHEETNDVAFLGGSGGSGTNLDMTAPAGNDLAFEPVVYLPNNELNRFKYNEDGTNFYDSWKTSEPVTVDLADNDANWLQKSPRATSTFVAKSGSSFSLGSSHKNKKNKVKRGTNVEVLSFEEAAKYGKSLDVKYYAPGSTSSTPDDSLYPNSHNKKHTAEVSVLQADGMRYNYALPVYNKTQKQVTFSADNDANNFNKTNIDVPSGLNVSGTYLQMVDKTTLPEYAQSWLVTSIVSADYVDLTGDGFTADDFGTWVKFDYKKKENKKWRFPYSGADLAEGKVGDKSDDMGFYTYGEKEVFYLDAVTTKTHYAKFFTSNRQDGIEALSETSNNNFLNSSPSSYTQMQKLDSIKLYAKSNYSNCIPEYIPADQLIKSVHFRYTYDLCPGVPNNKGASIGDGGSSASNDTTNNINYYKGKLTLKKVFFKYDQSYRGMYNPYEFNYGTRSDSLDNPRYDSRNIDRWGNFKNNSVYTQYGSSNKYPFNNMPYADQGSGSTAPAVSGWNLKQISLPSGSKINVDYESDDYAYVEDQKAVRMFDVIGTNMDHNLSYANRQPANYKEASLINVSNTNEFKIYFPLETPLTSSNRNALFYQKYLDNGNLKKMYFKSYMLVYLGMPGETWDWVDGFANIKEGGTPGTDYGVTSSSGSLYDLGFITLRGEHISILPNNVHPFTAAAINYLRLNRREVTESYMPNNTSALAQITNFLGSVPGMIEDVGKMLIGFNEFAYLHGSGAKVRLNGWTSIRLGDPDQKKFGGGLRVKKISFSDNWETSSGLNQRYGQTYSYAMEDGSSSGVAYEPQRGDEESALTMPINYSESIPLGGTNRYMLRTPLMKDNYPAQQVGYRRVVVKSDAPDRAVSDDSSNELKKSAAPITEYKFYTPKEFPVIFDFTDMKEKKMIRAIPIIGIFTNFKKKAAHSQGYVLELNDMPGKLCSVTSYARDVANSSNLSEIGAQIAKTEYVYQTENTFNPNASNKLNNLANVITSDSSYQSAYVGLNEEVYIDMKEDKYVNKTKTFGINIFAGAVYLFPTVIPFPIEYTETSNRTVVTNKIIYRRGLLKETRVTSEQSTVKTEIIAYDFETGAPILTKVNNEFEDAVYNYSIPAHHEYPLMGGAYKNYGIELKWSTPVDPLASGLVTLNTSSGFPSGKKASDYFTLGDMVYVENSAGNLTCHVMGTCDTGSVHGIYLCDANGSFISTPSVDNISKIRIIESGYRNFLDYTAGGIVSKNCSIVKYQVGNSSTLKSSPDSFAFRQSDKILNASAMAFTDRADLNCGLTDTAYNPFRWKTRGVWKPYKSYSYITDRKSSLNSSGNVPSNVRDDGWYTSFTNFNWKDIGMNPEWTEAGTVTRFSNVGLTLEQRDALGNYSSALFGHGFTVQTAMASNAGYDEIAFKSFEDDQIAPSCSADTVGLWNNWFTASSGSIDWDHAHTGWTSLKIPAFDSYEIYNQIGGSSTASCNDDKTDTTGMANLPLSSATSNCVCHSTFKPHNGKRYVISFWGQVPSSSNYNDYDDGNKKLYAEMVFRSGGSPIVGANVYVYPSGNHIEGWQRYYGEFFVPATADEMYLTVYNDNVTKAGYIDDLRIHPYNSSMVSYVYDMFTYRLFAELDANNYATIIGYNEQGSAETAKKETAKGLKSVSTSRVSVKLK